MRQSGAAPTTAAVPPSRPIKDRSPGHVGLGALSSGSTDTWQPLDAATPVANTSRQTGQVETNRNLYPPLPVSTGWCERGPPAAPQRGRRQQGVSKEPGRKLRTQTLPCSRALHWKWGQRLAGHNVPGVYEVNGNVPSWLWGHGWLVMEWPSRGTDQHKTHPHSPAIGGTQAWAEDIPFRIAKNCGKTLQWATWLSEAKLSSRSSTLDPTDSPLARGRRANSPSPFTLEIRPLPPILDEPTERAGRSLSPGWWQQVAWTTQRPSPAPDRTAPGARVSPATSTVATKTVAEKIARTQRSQ
ncbi:uncharacterized protein LOC144576367 isoform X3 [Callithrix jacchus]